MPCFSVLFSNQKPSSRPQPNMDRLGRYGNIRPERIEQFSVEFKKDLLQGQVSKKFKDRHENRRKEAEARRKRRQKYESDSSTTDSDSSGSSSGSSSSGSSGSSGSRWLLGGGKGATREILRSLKILKKSQKNRQNFPGSKFFPTSIFFCF